MSIDYDRLRQLVAEMEQGAAATTRYTWLDLARELLRLRDGVGELVERKRTAAELMRERANTNWRYDAERYIADVVDTTCDDLEDLLNGDTE